MEFKESQCDCERCSNMCHAPCCGTPQEMERIMDAGYGHRLCLDDWPGNLMDLHPALKGYEGGVAPFKTSSIKGCTFWKDGKCELHDKGLKPLGGRYAHHDMSDEDWMKIGPYLDEVWSTEDAKRIVEKWSKEYLDKEDWANDHSLLHQLAESLEELQTIIDKDP